MHFMCLNAVNRVMNDEKLLRMFYIPSDLWPAMRTSYGRIYDEQSKEYKTYDEIGAQFDLMGRFDWSWDGKNPPKLLEYNADTPSLLLESSAVQGGWFKEKFSSMDRVDKSQTNFIEKALKKSLKKIFDVCQQKFASKNDKAVGLLTVDYDDESAAQMLYLQKLINQTGKGSQTVIENISEMFLTYRNTTAKGEDNCQPVIQLYDKTVDCLINSYPKEWLVNEIKRDELLKYDLADIKTFEPWWKLILGNKALLPLLWSMYPNHPNLLPAFYDDPYSVRKNNDLN